MFVNAPSNAARVVGQWAAMTTQKTFVIAGVWALLVVLAVHFLQFPGSVPDFTRASGGGVLLDASPAFTPDATFERLAAYGEAGRQNYSFRNVTVDVLLPLSVFARIGAACHPICRSRVRQVKSGSA
jgi:hypothetical protein